MFEKFESFSKDRDKEKKEHLCSSCIIINVHITQVMFYYSRAIYREEVEKKWYENSAGRREKIINH